MSFLFSKKNQVPVGTKHTPSTKGRQLPGNQQQIQKKPGAGVNKSAKTFSKRKKLLLLAIMILALGGYNIWLIIHSFKVVPTVGNFNIQQISIPLGNNPFKGKWFDAGIDQDSHRRIMQFKAYMDSLSLTRAGRAEYDHIMATRPGLIDSVRLYESTYQLQNSRPTDPQGPNMNPKN
ncbi:hypothetical protein PV783_25000 [Chitinophaga sp. CC14]|uniref:hypothetical protein n=1 Tax=Chitinophaga sp. CC14 TaxID=3029199 RepID=UPI003B828EF4